MSDVIAEFGPVNLPDIVRYAGASGDFNPIHYDASWARRQGYRTNFAQGMFLMGWAGAVLAGDEETYVRRLQCRFVDQLFNGDHMRLRAFDQEDGGSSRLWVVEAGDPTQESWTVSAQGEYDLAPVPEIATT